jgi:small subunit ribosomal protein S6
LLRDYEILYIVRPELDDDGVNQAVKTVETLIKNLGGEPSKSDVWGRRRLAYEVAHLREGYYVLTDFTLPVERVTELEATLKISDTVFRHLVTRKPEKARRQGERRTAASQDGERAPGEQPQPAAAAATAAAPADAVAPEPEEEAEA